MIAEARSQIAEARSHDRWSEVTWSLKRDHMIA